MGLLSIDDAVSIAAGRQALRDGAGGTCRQCGLRVGVYLTGADLAALLVHAHHVDDAICPGSHRVRQEDPIPDIM